VSVCECITIFVRSDACLRFSTGCMSVQVCENSVCI